MRAWRCLFTFMLVMMHWSHEAVAGDDLSIRGRLTFVAGTDVDEIYRAEGWIRHSPSHLDFKLKLEDKDRQGLVKARIQYLPFPLGQHAAGFAARYQEKENADGVGALGLAVRFNGKQWKWPIRYYPRLNLFHSKPVVKSGHLRADCQIIFYHAEDEGSLRPGVDWLLTNSFSVGVEGRAYSDPDKNYFGVRLALQGKTR
jgi:hypothetical protein